MDLIEYAKWGIRVKEEPGTLGPFHLDKESNENNFGDLQGGWMCKFPCDAQGALDSAVTDSQIELLEPFEMPSANHLEEQHEYFNLEGLDKFTDSSLAEGNNNIISLKHPARINQQDGSTKNHAVLHNPLEENIVTSFSNSRETLNINVTDEEKHILDEVLNVRCDISEDLVSRANITNRREYVEDLSKKSDIERPNEIDFITENQNEILHSDVKYDSQENGVATGLKNRGTLESSLNIDNSICREDESSTKEFVEKAEQQNSQKANNNEFRISDISTFECPDCSEVLRSFNGFITHMNSHIIQEHLDVDSVQCKNCKRKFDDKRSLSFHKRACKYAKEGSLIPSPNKPNSNTICLTVNYPGENSPASNDRYALKENLEFDLSSHCQEVSRNFNEQQTSQPQELLAFNPKRKRQALSEECSSSDTVESGNCWTKQKLGAADDAFDVSWSSEIKCREEREGKSSKSVRTLSLRLFRFRRPRVVVKRTQVPVRSESLIKTFNSDLEDSCSSNEKALCQEEKVVCNTLKQLTKEPVISKGNKMSKCDSNIMSCTNILKPSPKQKHVLYSQKSWRYARQLKLAEAEKSILQTNTTGIHNEPQYVESPLVSEAEVSEIHKKSNELCMDASNEFPPKDVNVRSNLKIKIKPIVVLDRLNSLNLNYNSNKPSKESSSKFVGDLSSRKNLPREINFHMNSNSSEKYKDKSKKDAKAFAVQSARHSDFHCNQIKCSENRISLSDLEKRYCLKKCYVKLKRMSVEPFSLKTIGKHNHNEETGNEVKTCGKIKLRRMSSKLWAISSCSSPSENMEVRKCSEDCTNTAERICVANNTEYSSEIVVQAEMNDQKFKKSFGNHESKGSSPIFSEGSEETLHKHIIRGKRVKCFKSKCTCCQKRFFDEQELDQHLETHFSGFKCPNCSARFHFVMELHAHIAGCSLASLLDCHKAQSQIKQCQVVL